MNERILRVLEFNKIIEKLKQHTATSLGEELVLKLEPSIDIDIVNTKQQETDESAQLIRLNKLIPLGGISDIRPHLKRASLGGILNAKECLDVANTIYGGRQVHDFFDVLEENLPLLQTLSDRITPLRHLEKEINLCIDENGTVLDSASEKLRGLRTSIRTFENRIRERLNSYTKNRSNLLSNSIITIRNDRYVLPVKSEHRGSVGGIVHDQSASGQTLFMEPQAVVDLNNQLREAKVKEKQEIERILGELSDKIASHQSYLKENVTVLAEVDFIYSRAKLANEMNAAMPKINNKGIIKMKKARHPLIPQDEVVANDIEIGSDFTAIVITGPNTGGKTVVLKMVGLCTLMAQSGLQIPALDGCEIAVFNEVYADIGDEQSIEQNLSTFSSHMTNIVDIMKYADDRSFVLFDELGAGTDPQEGAALAISILDDVISRDARVIATTHYPELKAYGYNREKVVNASVEFDIKSLQPTYRLLIGVPGRSNAFEISKRLGLDENVIAQAKSHIGVDSKSVENMIASLEDSKKQAEKDYEAAYQTLLESETVRAEIQKEWKEFERNRERLYKKVEEKAEKALQKAREEAESIVSEIRHMKTNFKEHEWIEAKKLLDEAHPDLSTKDKTDKTKSPQGNMKISVDDEVMVNTFNQVGTVLERVKDNEYIVQVGMIKVNVKANDLTPIKNKQKVKEKPTPIVKGRNFHVRPELDLRGERYEDALFRLEKYVDDALLAGHSKVTIIHGKGTGALRKGVQKYAERHPRITSCQAGTPSEGGDGVSILEFS